MLTKTPVMRDIGSFLAETPFEIFVNISADSYSLFKISILKSSTKYLALILIIE